MTKAQQPVWVESDGVSNLPPSCAVGVYRMRIVDKDTSRRFQRFCFFDGNHFFMYAGSAAEAMDDDCMEHPTLAFDEGSIDAWWDYQGLMAKSQAKDEAAFGILVQGLTGGNFKIEGNRIDWSADAAIMATDEPGINAMAERNKPAPEPEKVIVGSLTIDMADLVEFLKAKQPKPEPNNTPRGILTMWNESADHRLGAWQQTGNFAD